MSSGARLPSTLAALAALCLACTAVTAPTTAPMDPPPSPGPTAAISASPTASGTPPPPATTTPQASTAPTLLPTASSSPGASGDGTGTFLEVIRDDMASPRSGFQTGDFEHHRVAYEEGRLIVEVKTPARSTWTMRGFGDWPLADIEATIERPGSTGEGFYGLTCGRSNDDFYAGLLDSLGGTVLLRVVRGQAKVLLRDDTPVPEASDGQPVDLLLKCVGTDAGGAPGLSFSVNGRVVASGADPSGFVSFLRGGFYVESGADTDGWQMTGDDFRVMVGLVAGDGPGPSLPPGGDPAVDALLLHVPETLRDGCRVVDRSETAAEVAVDCGTAAVPVATYLQYRDAADMAADYDAIVEAHPEATGSGCQSEPSEGPYTVDEVEVGRLLCVLADGAASIHWTDERTLIMGQSRAADASFEALYAWWLEAGPLP